MQRGSDEEIGLKYTGFFGLVFHVVSSVFHLFEIICLLTPKWALELEEIKTKSFLQLFDGVKSGRLIDAVCWLLRWVETTEAHFYSSIPSDLPIPTKTKILQPFSTVFVFLYFCLFVCLPFYTFALSICLSVCLFICLCLYVFISVCLFACMHICTSVFLYLCLSVCLHYCTLAFLPFSLFACKPHLPACLNSRRTVQYWQIFQSLSI